MIDPITVVPLTRDVLDVTGDPSRKSESATPRPPRSPLRVLVADDSSSFREILCSFLESLPGVQLCGAVGDGLEALRVAADTAPDVVLMDLVMPRMGGCEATRQLKRGPQPPRVVLLSICGDEELRQATRLAGADGFLSKRDVGTRLPELLELLPIEGAR